MSRQTITVFAQQFDKYNLAFDDAPISTIGLLINIRDHAVMSRALILNVCLGSKAVIQIS